MMVKMEATRLRLTAEIDQERGVTQELRVALQKEKDQVKVLEELRHDREQRVAQAENLLLEHSLEKVGGTDAHVLSPLSSSQHIISFPCPCLHSSLNTYSLLPLSHLPFPHPLSSLTPFTPPPPSPPSLRFAWKSVLNS